MGSTFSSDVQASEFRALPAQVRARLLNTAIATSNHQLWATALGDAAHRGLGPSASKQASGLPRLSFDFSSLADIAPLTPPRAPALSSSPLPTPAPDAAEGYGPLLGAASARTGVPAATLSAIIDAEAGKTADGRWNPTSRNPRSSAAGLGQFLSASWIGLAQTPGSFLHQVAHGQGWLDANGRVVPHGRAALLDLRFDPRHAIEAVADYARFNLDRFRAGGVVAVDAAETTRLAYLGHHLGPGDAERFLAGGLGEGRAARLLAAQIGHHDAARRVADAGSAAGAHRQWLTGYIDRRVMR